MNVDEQAWRSWPKVSVAKTGAANVKRYTDARGEGTEALGECWWCSRPAERLCDTSLVERIETEYEINGRKYKRFKEWISRGTCDARICETCTKGTPVRYCNVDDYLYPDEPRKSFVDYMDRCPYCQRWEEPPTRTEPDKHRAGVLDHARAAKLRPRPVS